MPIAFKEWAVTVRALAEGEQLITLRKGGIRETDRHFQLEHDRFFLYPTFDHQRVDLVRESHKPELQRALEEGVWADGEPGLHAWTMDGGIHLVQTIATANRGSLAVRSPSHCNARQRSVAGKSSPSKPGPNMSLNQPPLRLP